jgi:hypothetical protein
MLNSAWPSLIWHLYDYYFNAGGGLFCDQARGADRTMADAAPMPEPGTTALLGGAAMGILCRRSTKTIG